MIIDGELAERSAQQRSSMQKNIESGLTHCNNYPLILEASV